MNILITGFEPYGGEDYNPSGEIAEKMNGEILNGHKILGVKLPVSFKRVGEILESNISDSNPSVILNLGLAPRTAHIRVERVAINIMDGGPDNDGYRAIDEPIVPNGPAAYFSTLPIRRIVEALRSTGIPSAISNSAGTFLCNYVMYRTLHFIHINGWNVKAGFIHLPYTSRQVAGKTVRFPPPSLPFTMLVEAVKIIVKTSLENL